MEKIINLCHILDYKNGSMISRCLTKGGNEKLKELKPYTELSKDETIDLLKAITPHLSTKGEPSKQSVAILKLDEYGVQLDEESEVEPVSKEGGEPKPKTDKPKKEKVLGGTTTTKQNKKIKELETKYTELEKKYDSVLGELKAIRNILEIDKELN